MARTVFSSHEQVAHAWGTQSQTFGRSPTPSVDTNGFRGGNAPDSARVRFIGRVFYSYTTPVARLEPLHGRDALALLKVPNEWGPATGQHIAMAVSATSHLHDGRVFEVPHVGNPQGPRYGGVDAIHANNADEYATPSAVDHIGNVEYLRGKYFEALESARNTRRKLPKAINPAYDYANPDAGEFYLPDDEALRQVLRTAYAVAADYSEFFFPLPSDSKFPADFAAVENDVAYTLALREAAEAKRLAKLTPAELARRAAAKADREAKAERTKALQFADEAERLEGWREGLNVPTYRLPHSQAAYIRATGVKRDKWGTITGGTLETSQGARVPLIEAVRVFQFLKCVREAGKGWRPSGMRGVRVGMFAVSSVEPSGDFVAGCHRFVWPEIEALATRLGVFDLPCAHPGE